MIFVLNSSSSSDAVICRETTKAWVIKTTYLLHFEFQIQITVHLLASLVKNA